MPPKAANKVFVVTDAGKEFNLDTPYIRGVHATLESAKVQCTALADDMAASERNKAYETSTTPELDDNELFGVDVVDDEESTANSFRVVQFVMPDGTVTAADTKTAAASKSKATPAANKGTKRAAPAKEANGTDEDDDDDAPPAKKAKPKKAKAVVRAEAAASLATKDNLPQGSNTSLSGLKIMITGTLEGVTRNEVELLIEKHGGVMVKTISAKPDLVCVASKAGAKKIAEIEKKGIDTIDQEELWSMIEGGDEDD